jgi:alpha-glucuronidase
MRIIKKFAFSWFHHLPWDYRMKSGWTLWDELCHKYDEGVQSVSEFLDYWQSFAGRIDKNHSPQEALCLITILNII